MKNEIDRNDEKDNDNESMSDDENENENDDYLHQTTFKRIKK